MTIRRLVIGVLVALLLASIVIVFFNRLAGADLILARGDTLLYFYPYWQFAADALKEGQVPLWNPNLFMGAPFLANSQVGFFYPLNWPLWLLLVTPYAASFSIILHIVIASFGAYLMARRCFSLSGTAAVLAALLFSLGGYLTAQVEHLNQLQGLAWLPWYFVVICPWRPNLGSRRDAIKISASIAAILSLQLLSGHTQTVFISLVAVVIWLVVTWYGSFVDTRQESEEKYGTSVWLKSAWSFASPILWSALLALCIAAVQLLPTVELSSQSLRRGGLPAKEVLSFSLQPLQLGQSLLPAYDSVVFSEYVLFIPITALLLAIVGARRLWHTREGRPLLVLAGIGLFLALGRFNPIYHFLAITPGFNYFRAPARWSVLFALAIAMAAGAGWQALSRLGRGDRPEHNNNQYFKTIVVGVVIIIVLIAWGILSAYLAPLLPAAPETVIERPTHVTISIWVGELVAAFILIYMLIRYRARGWSAWAILVLTIVILFLSSRALSYNHPTTAQAYFEQRPPVSRLLASDDCIPAENDCAAPNGRILGLSDIFFDLGDQTELSGIYGEVLGDKEWFDYLVANKQKEVLGPNLPLAFGLESVDGFDGGILPLERYASIMRLILPDEELAFDGRLREYLDSVPDEKWLDLFGAKYVITDKVGDQWRREVFFDMKLPTKVTQATGAVGIGYLPNYEATNLWLISEGQPGTITVFARDGREWLLSPEQIESDLWQIIFPEPAEPTKITLDPCDPNVEGQSCDTAWQVNSLALVDERDGSFVPLSAGDYRLIYSGDVKIYENLDVMPRAMLIHDWRFVDDVEEGIALMQSADFDPSVSAVVLGAGPETVGAGNGHASFISYLPEYTELRTESDVLALLLVSDAFYPGWEATIDGVPAQISAANIMFRGIFVPPGEHEIELRYVPVSYQVGRLMSITGLVVWMGMAIYAFILPYITNRRNANRTSDAPQTT